MKLESFQVSVQLCIFVFDILMLIEKPLLERSLWETKK